MNARTILAGALAVSIIATASAQNPISVYVNQTPVQFADANPRMMGERVMVPLRGVFEQMGADVDWNEARQEVTATMGERNVKLNVGQYQAWINGQAYTMDAAPMKMMNRVFVPLRFLGEALGGEVRWEPSMYAVYIDTANANVGGGNTNNNNVGTVWTVESNTILPLMLNNELNSKTAKRGDTFTATLDTRGNADYAGLPRGTIVQGHIVSASAKTDKDPGVLDLTFDRVVLPNGQVTPLDASLINLESKNIRTENGIMVANQTAKKDDLKYVGIGAGAGALLALVTKGNLLTNSLIGGALGYLFGLTQKDAQQFNDVTLKPDTKIGIMLDQDLVIRK